VLWQTIEDCLPWLQHNALRLAATSASCVILYVLTVGILRDKRKSDIRFPSTFFSLDQLISKRWFKGVSLFFAGSLTILYAALALDAASLLTATERLLFSLVKHKFASGVQGDLDEIAKALPNWLEPLTVLVIFLVLFAGKMRKILVTYRDLLLTASGLYSIFDETALDVAEALLKKFGDDFNALERGLRKQFSEAPLPEEFVGNKGEQRLAYQLIWLSQKATREEGLVHSLHQLEAKFGAPVRHDSSFKLDLVHLVISSIAFVVLMGVYVVLAPLLHGVVSPPLRWPDPKAEGWSDVIRYVLQFTLGFVFPLMLALNMYPVRRRAYWRKEAELTTFGVVAAIQSALAFVVLELFNIVDVSIATVQKDDYSIFYPRLHLAAFLYSLVPMIAFALFIKFRDWSISFPAVVVLVSLSVGLSFAACEFLYECYLPAFDHFYWYQGLLGVSISLAFFLSGSITEQFGNLRRT